MRKRVARGRHPVDAGSACRNPVAEGVTSVSRSARAAPRALRDGYDPGRADAGDFVAGTILLSTTGARRGERLGEVLDLTADEGMVVAHLRNG